jgi:Uma2 family endonuclease
VLSPPPLYLTNCTSRRWNLLYRAKWVEYAALDIAEYWIVDLTEACVTVCILEAGCYRNTVFKDDEAIASPIFPQLTLTAAQVLNAH